MTHFLMTTLQIAAEIITGLLPRLTDDSVDLIMLSRKPLHHVNHLRPVC